MAGKDDKELFTGFANAFDDKGEAVNAREVDPFVDESDEGKRLLERQKTASSITQFHTDDQSTDGAPAADVPAKSESKTPDADAAEGKGASGS